MKILQIAYTNQKGQLVIPKKMRDQFAIDESVPLKLELKSGGIQVTPIKDLFTNSESKRQRFLNILEKTQGAWSDFDEKAWNKQKALESKLTAERKKPW